jgi:nucleotide-binding universal stress UspA family protein
MAGIKKILCAVDFSEHSPRVADYAATLARSFGAEVLCLYVAPSLSEYLGFHVPPSSIENFVGEIVAGADTKETSCPALPGLWSAPEGAYGLRPRSPWPRSKTRRPDILVMGTHGRKGIDRIR